MMILNIEQKLERWFRATPRQALEFVLLVSMLVSAEATERSLIVGGSVATIGFILRIVASGFRYSESEFKARGLYRFVRHPHHLGTMIVGIGVGVSGQNAFAMAGLIVVAGIYFRSVIIAEEKRLLKNWGPRYGVFRANVSALLPQLIPFVAAGGEGSDFSLKNSLVTGRFREVNFLFVLVLSFAAMCWSGTLEDRRVYTIVLAGTIAAFVLFRGVYYGYAGRHRRARGVVSIGEI
jgi:protein-S-isoprenylcysteine O-methyltransferase Ste14